MDNAYSKHRELLAVGADDVKLGNEETSMCNTVHNQGL